MAAGAAVGQTRPEAAQAAVGQTGLGEVASDR